jgi:hypothetical protein
LQELTVLELSGRGITDKGLETLKQLPKLQMLSLRFTSVTDAGVKHLIDMKSLTTVDLRYMAITIRGLKRLQEARPEIKIIEPDRAVWLREIFHTGARLTVATNTKRGIVVSTIDDLPKVDFAIQIVDYNDLDGELALPKPWQGDADAFEIRLANTKFHGQGLVNIANCKGLQILDLTNTNVADEHLSALHNVKTLRQINLTGTMCTVDGIAKLKQVLPECEVIGR